MVLYTEKMQPMVCSWFVVTTVLLVSISSSRSGLLFAAASDTIPPEGTEPKVAGDECVRRCGNVNITWPFGLVDKCAWNPDFVLSCDNTSSPPQLFTGNIPVFNISVEDSTMIVSLRNAFDCYSSDGTLFRRSVTKRSIALNRFFTFSPTRNRFMVVGCDTIALLSDASDKFGSGCISYCSSNVSFSGESSCAGLGCCQTFIPPTLRRITITINSGNKHRDIWNFNPCGKAFLVDNNTFNISLLKLPGFGDAGDSNLVLDWVGGTNITCENALKNSSAYACGNNTKCTYSRDADGYRCSCKDGYTGNPYNRTHGCHDIDECKEPGYTCHGNCKNKPGNYTCHCPFGMEGDGKVACQISRLSVIAAVIVALVLCVILGALIWVLWKRRTREKNFERNGGYLLKNQVKIFTEAQIKEATNDFSEMIGEDILCSVYKGMMPEADVINAVAVKKAKDEVTDKKKVRDVHASSVNREFHDEIILQINHKNVVKLLGVCLQTKVPMLVHEYFPKGSLHDLIYDKAHWHVFGLWKNRLRIALETASALQYLHSLANPPVMHGDIKPKNILLDDDYTVKISDFRASSLILPGEASVVVGGAKGDLAYLDPEYLETNNLTTKSDVYSFGVILVELLTGFEPNNQGNPVLQPFKWAVEQKTLDRMISIMKNVDANEREEIEAVAVIAKNCLNNSSEKRPEMKDVAEQLSWIKRNSQAYHQEDIEAAKPEAKPGTI